MIKFVKKHIVVFLILGIIFFQNPIWILWKFPYMAASFLFCVLLYLKRNSSREIHRSKNALAIIVLILGFVILPFLRGGLHISNIVYILCFIAALSITYQEASMTLEFLTKGFGAIIGVSLAAWIVHQVFFPFPMMGEIDLTEMKGGYTVMQNYGLFVQNPAQTAFRFYSVFDEPGVVGTLGAYILFVNKYQLNKWYNVAILLGCLCSLSLAFYALTIIGLVYTSIGSVKRLFVIFVIIAIVLWIGYDFLKENEDFNSVIIGRMMNASDSLNDRAGDAVDSFYKKMGFVDFLMGIGYNRVVELGMNEGASYKNFIVENGLVSLLILIYAYWSLNKRNNKDVLVFVGMFWLSFLQRPTSFIGWQMLLYACVVNYLGHPVKQLKDKNENIVYKPRTAVS